MLYPPYMAKTVPWPGIRSRVCTRIAGGALISCSMQRVRSWRSSTTGILAGGAAGVWGRIYCNGSVGDERGKFDAC